MREQVRRIRMEWEQLPWALAAFFFVFALIPPVHWGLAPLSAPFSLIGLFNVLFLGLVPYCLAYSLWKKSRWFFSLLLAECGGLIGVVLLTDGAIFPRAVLIGSTAYMAFLVGSPGLLYPMMTRNPRFWRRSVRYRVGKTVEIRGGTFGGQAFLEDCSETGLALTLPESRLRKGDLAPGTHLDVMIRSDVHGSHHIPVSVVWSAPFGMGDRKVGCESRDRQASRSYLSRERSQLRALLPERTNPDERIEKKVRYTAAGLWLLCAGFALLLP